MVNKIFLKKFILSQDNGKFLIKMLKLLVHIPKFIILN